MSTSPSNPRRVRADALPIALLVLAGLLGSTSAAALRSDREQDLDVRAGYNQLVATKPSHALFRNNVRIEQGSLKVRGDEARVYDAEGDGGRRIVVTGAPARLEQMLDNDGGRMTAAASQIEYNDASNIAVLTGDVVVIQEGKSEFRGPRMVYNTATGAMEGGSPEAGGEIRMTFKPQPKKPAKASQDPGS